MLLTEPKSSKQQDFRATERRKHSKRKSRERDQLNKIDHCQHDLVPDCACVQSWAFDSTRELTKSEEKVGAAKAERSIMSIDLQLNSEYSWLAVKRRSHK